MDVAERAAVERAPCDMSRVPSDTRELRAVAARRGVVAGSRSRAANSGPESRRASKRRRPVCVPSRTCSAALLVHVAATRSRGAGADGAVGQPGVDSRAAIRAPAFRPWRALEDSNEPIDAAPLIACEFGGRPSTTKQSRISRECSAAGRNRLDPETVRIIEDNLLSIDQAIEQSRKALRADPANVYLNSHFAASRNRKLALLRRATALAMARDASGS